jgi:hypothetical protein
MKIEFLDDAMTRAKITRGWFRRENAIIIETDTADHHLEDLELGFIGYPFWVWVFETTRRPVARRISIKVHNKKTLMLRAREDAKRPAEWIRIES